MSFLYTIRRIRQNRIKKLRLNQNEQRKIKRPSPMITFRRESLARDISLFLTGSPGKDVLRDIKGTSLFTSRLHGSMTVEAAIVLPLLLFFFLNLFSGIEMLRLHGKIQMAMWETGRQISVYGYAYAQVTEKEQRNQILAKAGGMLFSQTEVKNQIVHYLGKDYLDASPLTYGAKGLNLLESDFLQENDDLDIKVTYQVSPWVNIIGFREFRMSNRYFCHAWTGYEISVQDQRKGTGDCVYVTEYGKVYHETLECSYLKRTKKAVSLAEAQAMRNQFGEHYYPCGLCNNRDQGELVYLTMGGERYHYAADCPALKRIIHTILRTEAQKQYEPCNRCGRSV